MITVNIKGGLGNQMFQYAAGRALALKHSTSLRLLRSEHRGDISRDFSLTNFNIKAEITNAKKALFIAGWTERVRQKITGDFHVAFDPKFSHKGKNSYLDGYFQSELFFKDYEKAIREDFSLRAPLNGTKAVLEEIIKNDPQAVSLHVRRGDYLTHPDFGGVITKEYYEEAAAELRSRLSLVKFYVFSDDISWCQKELGFLGDANFISNPDLRDFEEMYLMSLARHHVIANSSFSWWGAWLNPRPDKIVIAPKRWSNLHEDWYRDIIPPTWTRI